MNHLKFYGCFAHVGVISSSIIYLHLSGASVCPPVAPQSEAGIPESECEEVRDEQGRDEDLEEICGEDPTLLHDSASPHTQRH